MPYYFTRHSRHRYFERERERERERCLHTCISVFQSSVYHPLSRWLGSSVESRRKRDHRMSPPPPWTLIILILFDCMCIIYDHAVRRHVLPACDHLYVLSIIHHLNVLSLCKHYCDARQSLLYTSLKAGVGISCGPRDSQTLVGRS